MVIRKIISGGQTGADRGGLLAAMNTRLQVGGYCPVGRLAEDGKIPDIFPLQEHGYGYLPRTYKNIAESDGTICFFSRTISPGTQKTIAHCYRIGKPILALDLTSITEQTTITTIEFLKINGISVLNIAGSRESKCPGIQTAVRKFITKLLLCSNT